MSERRANAKDRFHELIMNLHVGVVVQSPSAEVLVCNAAALSLLGLDLDQYHGKTSYDPDWNIMGEDGTTLGAEARPIARVLATLRPVRDFVMGIYRPKSRDRVWVLVNAEPVLDAAGNIDEIVVTLSDLTERRRLEGALLEAQKLESIGRLAGGIAHDFNNLLGVIISATSLAMASLPETARARTDLQISLDAAERAAAFTRQLLTFARRKPFAPSLARLNVVVSSLAPLLERVLGPHALLVIEDGKGTWPTLMDVAQMEQILVNLASNARDSMPSGGTLRVRTDNVTVQPGSEPITPGDYARVTVQDDGCGMSATTRARIFEPFFTTKELGTGTGLGLATVHGIVQQHGGHIVVDSEVGRGTTFTLYLRRAAGEEATALPSEPVSTPNGGETILLAEDQTSLRLLLKRILVEHGYTVLTASNGVEALEVAAGHPSTIHLLLTDLSMPMMNGRELAARLRQERPGIRVVITSGLVEHDRGDEGDGLSYIDKPYAPDALAAHVRASLDS